VNAVAELADVCTSLLGDAATAVILHGSLVFGDFAPPRSDIDLLVVVAQPLTDRLRRALADAVSAVAVRRQPWVDVRVVTRAAARTPRREPSMELYVGRHPDVSGEIELELGPTIEPDLLFELSMCREHGRSLSGPPPGELIGVVPLAWMLDVGDGYLKRWQEVPYEEEYAELMVFTACRLWRLHDEGRHCSKSDAAAWVAARDLNLTAPSVALARRSGRSARRPARGDVMDLLERVRAVLATDLAHESGVSPGANPEG